MVQGRSGMGSKSAILGCFADQDSLIEYMFLRGCLPMQSIGSWDMLKIGSQEFNLPFLSIRFTTGFWSLIEDSIQMPSRALTPATAGRNYMGSEFTRLDRASLIILTRQRHAATWSDFIVCRVLQLTVWFDHGWPLAVNRAPSDT